MTRLHLAGSNNFTSGPPLSHGANEASSNSLGSAATGSGPASNVSSLVINATVTAQPSTGGDGGSGVPGGVIALMLCLLLVGVAVFCIIFYLKRTGKLYKVIPFKRLANSPRRSSFSSSDRALHMKDAVHDDDDDNNDDPAASPAVASGRRHNNNNNSSSGGGGGGGGGRGGDREREAASMFTIEDRDMDSVDMGDGNSEYFYDEVFGKSMFEDEATNASMRQLYLASDKAGEEDMMDVDAIVDSIVGKPETAKT